MATTVPDPIEWTTTNLTTTDIHSEDSVGNKYATKPGEAYPCTSTWMVKATCTVPTVADGSYLYIYLSVVGGNFGVSQTITVEGQTFTITGPGTVTVRIDAVAGAKTITATTTGTLSIGAAFFDLAQPSTSTGATVSWGYNVAVYDSPFPKAANYMAGELGLWKAPGDILKATTMPDWWLFNSRNRIVQYSKSPVQNVAVCPRFQTLAVNSADIDGKPFEITAYKVFGCTVEGIVNRDGLSNLDLFYIDNPPTGQVEKVTPSSRLRYWRASNKYELEDASNKRALFWLMENPPNASNFESREYKYILTLRPIGAKGVFSILTRDNSLINLYVKDNI